MDSVSATQLKNRLGPVLARAALAPVAILRHGRVVAYLVPAGRPPVSRAARVAPQPGMTRAQEERLVDLCASGDLRPSRWLRAGDPRTLAGVATMLASQPEFDRPRLLALAERLHPGMTLPREFGRWLAASRVRPARFLPMVRARHAELESTR
jgi:antitoxin (DNA-binding transcriptional repressor) of toxin-antitoxin stability system